MLLWKTTAWICESFPVKSENLFYGYCLLFIRLQIFKLTTKCEKFYKSSFLNEWASDCFGALCVQFIAVQNYCAVGQIERMIGIEVIAGIYRKLDCFGASGDPFICEAVVWGNKLWYGFQ